MEIGLAVFLLLVAQSVLACNTYKNDRYTTDLEVRFLRERVTHLEEQVASLKYDVSWLNVTP